MKLLRNTLRAIKEHPDLTEDIIDSFSDNQFKAKLRLLELIDQNGLIDYDSQVVIFGCWYGSILIESLAPKVKSIIAVDVNPMVITVGKNHLFNHFDNIEWRTYDVFEEVKYDFYRETDLFINTSCEHMKPMQEWKVWEWIAKRNKPYFAFQSNDMYGIEGHVNCVDDMSQFKAQMPKSMIIDTEEIEDSRGTRFTIIGELC